MVLSYVSWIVLPPHSSVQFSSVYSHYNIVFTLYIVFSRNKITDKAKKEKKEINGIDRSVRWSEELTDVL